MEEKNTSQLKKSYMWIIGIGIFILIVGIIAILNKNTSQSDNPVSIQTDKDDAGIVIDKNSNPTIEKVDSNAIANYDAWKVYENLVYDYVFFIPPGFQNYDEYNGVFTSPDPQDSGVTLIQENYQKIPGHEDAIPLPIRIYGNEGDSPWNTSSNRYKAIKVGKNTYAKERESETYQINQSDVYVYLDFEYVDIDQLSINAILDSFKFTEPTE